MNKKLKSRRNRVLRTLRAYFRVSRDPSAGDLAPYLAALRKAFARLYELEDQDDPATLEVIRITSLSIVSVIEQIDAARLPVENIER